jgi:hypothetical protein
MREFTITTMVGISGTGYSSMGKRWYDITPSITMAIKTMLINVLRRIIKSISFFLLQLSIIKTNWAAGRYPAPISSQWDYDTTIFNTQHPAIQQHLFYQSNDWPGGFI